MALWSLTPYNRYNRSLFDWPSERYWNSWDPFEALDLIVPTVARLGIGGRQEGGDHPSDPLIRNDDNFTVKMDVSNFATRKFKSRLMMTIWWFMENTKNVKTTMDMSRENSQDVI